ncbi:MFS general substrate transporter [Lentithecium fluviatile CBS 122367]|uniref:MFS general substrate transporter n=1 Tax=Lentithecium fluviatile CBS 122367 TaxID=1168545 RepID=A0A6G1JBC1_9PLEO|nr:MFS general substrate transporter [Lentithecium fluviatile CBS 122367]
MATITAFDKDIETIQPSPPVPSEASSQLDDTYEAYKNNQGLEIGTEEAKKVLRKIDLHVVPILFFTYLLQYLDKNGINYASAFGLEEGTNLSGQDYSWLGSIFYFGYLLGQYPSGYLLQRLPIAKFLGFATLGWGIILLTTPACTSFAGMATNRFLLGLLEATVNPGFVLIMSMWYTSAEQPLRLESYYCTNGIATMFGGLIGYAVGHITTGLPRWMYLFLIFGATSTLMGVITLLVLPDLPTTARFLTEHQRIIAVERVAGNRQGVKNRHFKKYQAWQTLQDPKTWILFVMAVGAQIPNAALTSFSSLIIKSFGVDTLGTQYLQIPGGAVQFLSLIAGGFVCTHWPNSRCITMTVANSLCIIGAAMLVALPASNKWGRLIALWLCYFQGLGFSMSLTIVSSNVAGYTKKQLTGAALFTGYCVGNIIGPQTFKTSEKPGYHSAYIAMLIGYCVKLIAVLVLFAYMWSVNKKRDRESPSGIHLTDEEEKAAVEAGMHDVTEIDNKGFRYIL